MAWGAFYGSSYLKCGVNRILRGISKLRDVPTDSGPCCAVKTYRGPGPSSSSLAQRLEPAGHDGGLCKLFTRDELQDGLVQLTESGWEEWGLRSLARRSSAGCLLDSPVSWRILYDGIESYDRRRARRRHEEAGTPRDIGTAGRMRALRRCAFRSPLNRARFSKLEAADQDSTSVDGTSRVLQNGHGLCATAEQNGIFVTASRRTAPIGATVVLSGADGPSLVMEVERPALAPAPKTQRTPVAKPAAEADEPASYAQRYFGPAVDDESVSGRTMMIRRVFEDIQKKQKRKYRSIVAVVALAAVGAGGYAYTGIYS